MNTRVTCRYCLASHWVGGPITAAHFYQDHDRPDGRVCRLSQRSYARLEAWGQAQIEAERLVGTLSRIAKGVP